MEDKYEGYTAGLTAPGIDADPITPSDSADLPQVSRGIYVGSTGHIRVELLSGKEVTFRNMQAGGFYPLRVRKVLATGTTANNLVAIA
ncbi:MAG: hypothetical protein OIF40_16030 [Mangrovicoccus sp.]|nr:hypothetical protein [Mangrovicoccus sp.]